MMNMDKTSIDILIQWLTQEDGPDLSTLKHPRLKPSLETIYPVFVALYALVGLVGIIGNVTLLVVLIRRGILKDPTSVFLINTALLGLILAACVTPMTLTALLLQTWVLGAVACWLYPMLQALPLHATSLAFLSALADRYMDARYPKAASPRSRIFIAVAATAFIWFVGTALVVPFVLHVSYTDLGSALGKDLEGVGLCSVNSDREDVRKIHQVGLTLMYCFCPPVAAFLMFSTRFLLLKRKKIVESYEMKIRRGDNNYYYGSPSYGRSSMDSVDGISYSLFQELATVRYLLYMVLGFMACWCPLIVITTTHQLDHKLEGRDSYRADILHLSLLLVAFLSSWVVPCLYTIWRRSARVIVAEEEGDDESSSA